MLEFIFGYALGSNSTSESNSRTFLFIFVGMFAFMVLAGLSYFAMSKAVQDTNFYEKNPTALAIDANSCFSPSSPWQKMHAQLAIDCEAVKAQMSKE